MWNCQREMGVSPGSVCRVIENSLNESVAMRLKTRTGCCRMMASSKCLIAWPRVRPGGTVRGLGT